MDNKEIIINNNEVYKTIKDIVCVRNNENENYLEQSLFTKIYEKLSESEQDILDEKYNCCVCNSRISDENPYFCYICQKIFHEKCLKIWEKKRIKANEPLNCPNCRNILELKDWKKKLDFKDNKKNDAQIMNKINNLEKNENFYNNLNQLNASKIKKLEDENKNILKKHNNFLAKTSKFLKTILDKFTEIDSISYQKKNFNLNNIIQNISNKNIQSNFDDISNIIFEQFESLIKLLKNKKECAKKTNEKIRPQTTKFSVELNINEKNKKNNKISASFNPKKEKEINLIYTAKYECYKNIFGEKFVKNNFNNIKLSINGKESSLVYEYKLKKGNNNIKMIILKKLKNLEYMFYECDSLINIDELKSLDTSEVINFSNMFAGNQSLKNVNSLENWNVSNSQDFSFMFNKCYQLSDINSLKNWNVSNCYNFSGMFSECSSLISIEPLENWNVSKGISFASMFYGCDSLYDINAFKNWNISNSNDVSEMFSGCYTIDTLEPVKNWNVSKCKFFTKMFYGCNAIKDISPLRNWNVSKVQDLDGFLRNCNSIINRGQIIIFGFREKFESGINYVNTIF